MSNEVSVSIKGLINSDNMKKQFKAALPSHLSVERFVRIATTALTKNPKLVECTQESFMKCLLDLSSMGLEPDGRNAHLIPYRNNKNNTMECTLIVDYKGKVDLAMRSGLVSVIHADVVCENDEFEYNLGEITKHKIDFRKPRGNVYAVYAYCKMKDGTSACRVMSVEEVESVRKRSKSKDAGPWVTDWNEMAKKTPFHRLSKWLRLSPEYMDAISHDMDDYEDCLDVEATPVEQRLLPKSLDDVAAEHAPEPPQDAQTQPGKPSRSELNKMLLQARKAAKMTQEQLEDMARAEYGKAIGELSDEGIVGLIDLCNAQN
jgi:recombination protein RecT